MALDCILLAKEEYDNLQVEKLFLGIEEYLTYAFTVATYPHTSELHWVAW